MKKLLKVKTNNSSFAEPKSLEYGELATNGNFLFVGKKEKKDEAIKVASTKIVKDGVLPEIADRVESQFILDKEDLYGTSMTKQLIKINDSPISVTNIEPVSIPYRKVKVWNKTPTDPRVYFGDKDNIPRRLNEYPFVMKAFWDNSKIKTFSGNQPYITFGGGPHPQLGSFMRFNCKYFDFNDMSSFYSKTGLTFHDATMRAASNGSNSAVISNEPMSSFYFDLPSTYPEIVNTSRAEIYKIFWDVTLLDNFNYAQNLVNFNTGSHGSIIYHKEFDGNYTHGTVSNNSYVRIVSENDSRTLKNIAPAYNRYIPFSFGSSMSVNIRSDDNLDLPSKNKVILAPFYADYSIDGNEGVFAPNSGFTLYCASLCIYGPIIHNRL